MTYLCPIENSEIKNDKKFLKRYIHRHTFINIY